MEAKIIPWNQETADLVYELEESILHTLEKENGKTPGKQVVIDSLAIVSAHFMQMYDQGVTAAGFRDQIDVQKMFLNRFRNAFKYYESENKDKEIIFDR